jgi:hypothetical protein
VQAQQQQILPLLRVLLPLLLFLQGLPWQGCLDALVTAAAAAAVAAAAAPA